MAALGVFGAALEQCDCQATAGDALFADALSGGQVDSGLDLVGQPKHGGAGTGLDKRAQRFGAGGEVGKRPRLVAHALGDRMNAYPDPGDDAEDALGSDEKFAKVRSGGGCGRPTEIQNSHRADDPHAADHVVEAAIAGGVLTGGPGRGETADAGEAEALREVSQ